MRGVGGTSGFTAGLIQSLQAPLPAQLTLSPNPVVFKQLKSLAAPPPLDTGVISGAGPL